jgi:hypothetical protein
MDVYYSGSPNLHHYFLKTLGSDDLSDVSHLRFDHHCDFSPIGFKPTVCDYVSKSINYFSNTLWVNKPNLGNDNLTDFYMKQKGKFMVYDYMSYQFFLQDVNDVIPCLDKKLARNIVLDVDPDITIDYPCNFENGLMHIDELAFIIKGVKRNVLYAFFSSSLDFAKEVCSKAGFSDCKFKAVL